MSYISSKLRQKIIKEAKNRCGYCLGEQKYIFAVLEIEHIFPQSLGGKTIEENLWLACPLCNSYKATQISGFDSITGKKVKLFNPRKQNWQKHFKIIDNVKIIGKTACGRATVEALQMNNEIAIMVRKNWSVAGWYPPKEFIS